VHLAYCEDGFQKFDENISLALICERNIPTERQPLVGEVSVNFFGKRLWCGQRNGSPRQYSRLSRQETIHFLPSSSSVVLTTLSEPSSRPTTFRTVS
jgi:hypothetical protein